jgi:PAS domain S-box-containing protein
MMQILDLAPVGILAAELREGQPLVYVNKAFEAITGYAAADALGRNCRYLQGSDRLQPEILQLREAIGRGAAASVMLRNYRRDGRLFWNELQLVPVAASGAQPTHYVGLMQDVTRLKETVDRLDQEVQIDRLTGALNRAAFFDTISCLATDVTPHVLIPTS